MKKGQSILHKLVEKSDVLIENFVPGTLSNIQMDYESLEKINPKLIYCSISGYGSTGPYSKRGGYDVIAASVGGLLHITGPENGEPCKVGVAMTDLATGLYTHGAIMAALLQRSKTGIGQHIECNLLSTQLSCLVNLASNYLNAGLDADRRGTAHASIVPYQAFKSKDNRWITIGAGSNDLFIELCDALGKPELKEDPKFSTNSLRVKHREELISILSTTINTETCEEWLKRFQNCKFPYGPVNDIRHAFQDPQVEYSGIVQKIGDYCLVGPAVNFSSGGNYIRSSPPKLGEHTREILSSLLQFSDPDIEAAFQSGIVQ